MIDEGATRQKLVLVVATLASPVACQRIDNLIDAAGPELDGVVLVTQGENRARYTADLTCPLIIVALPELVGPVKAYKIGLEQASAAFGSDAIAACLHDDLIFQGPSGWAARVKIHFAAHPDCGLAGFGGAMGIGQEGMYDRPFDPHTLARVDFGSNMRDAAAHGQLWLTPRKVACLDGFSLIGRAGNMAGSYAGFMGLGVVHHAYDTWLGAVAHVGGQDVWFLPERVHHLGGATAVGDSRYQEWLQTLSTNDQEVWLKSHRAFWEWGKRTQRLPFRIEEPV